MLARSGPMPTRGDRSFEVKCDGFRAIVSTDGAPLLSAVADRRWLRSRLN